MNVVRPSTAGIAALLALAATIGSCAKPPELVAPEPGLERMIIQQRPAPYRGDPGRDGAPGMRTPPPGTVSLESATPGPATTGIGPGGYLEHVPIPVDAAFIRRGQERFAIVCSHCHGSLGDGESVVAEHMDLVRPRNLHDARIRPYPVGRIYQVITDGFGLMASHADVLAQQDRWAVAAYVKVLQLSRHAEIATLPAAFRAAARERLP